MVPRPLGSQMIAERPGEILMMDYILLGPTKTGYKYVLMLADKFSRFVEFIPAYAATSVVAARAIIQWSARQGLPDFIISDGGPHFKNELLADLNDCMGIKAHITLAYCPWANGSIEVVGRDLLYTLKNLCSEFKVSFDEWDLILPVATYAINHRPREILGGKTSVNIMTGRKPRTTIDLVLYSGPNLKEAKENKISVEDLQNFVRDLDKSVCALHEAAISQEQKQRRRRAIKESNAQGAMRFEKGDYVVVSASNNQAHKHKLSKLSVNWHGPYEVVALVDGSPSTLKVRLVGAPADKTFDVSWRKVRRIAGPTLAITQAVQDCALHDQQEFTVEDLIDWGFDDDDQIIIQVRWLGFDASEDTWEPMSQLYEDVKHKVRKFVENEQAPQLTEKFKELVSKVSKISNKKLKFEISNPLNSATFTVRRRPTTGVGAPESPPRKRSVSHDLRVADLEEKTAGLSKPQLSEHELHRINQRVIRAEVRAACNDHHQIPLRDSGSSEDSNEASTDC